MNVHEVPIKQPNYVMTPDNVMDVTLSEELVKRTRNLEDRSIDLAIRVKEAREFLMWSTNHMKEAWFDWLEKAGQASKEMNLFRMSFDREAKTIIASAKDTKEFFNSPEYVTAHDRLKEMVGLLDRFAELKKDGTLDAFSDFILKVSCK